MSQTNLKLLLISGLLIISSNIIAAELPAGALSTLSPGNFPRLLEMPSSEEIEPNSPFILPIKETYSKLPFDVGERLKYVVTYLGVKVGAFEYNIRQPIKWKNTWAHRITGEVKNADWYAWMVTLHDSMETIFASTPKMEPLRFFLNQQEPVTFKQTKVINFSAEDGKVKQKTKRKGREEKYDEFPLASETKDALASVFYIRAVSQSKDVRNPLIEFPIFTSEKTWVAKANFIKEETISVEGKSFDCDLYKLKTHFGQLMEQKGDFLVWVTRDFRRLPVYIEAQVKFGYIKLGLQEWDQGKADPLNKQIFESIKQK